MIATGRHRPRGVLADRWLLAVIAMFLLSRSAAMAAGVRFDASPLGYFLQYLDPHLLRARLGESLWYLHSQPPLFNLLLGVVLKLAPDDYPTLLSVLWMAAGLLLAIALYRVQVRLGVRPALAAVATVLFSVAPAAILYENWLFYTQLETLLLALCALLLHRYLSRGRVIDGALLMASAAALVLTRSLFHVGWLAAVAALPLASRSIPRRRTLRLALLPLAVTLFWYGRSAALFGGFSGSSWLGMSVAKMTTFQLPEEERSAMVARGELSPVALIQPYSRLDAYGGLTRSTPPTGIEALDRETKSTGASNYNHRAIPAISRLYMHDALTVLVHRPGTFLRGSAAAYYYYLFPSSIYWFLDRNRSMIRGYDRAYNIVVYGQIAYHEAPPGESPEASARRRFLKLSPVIILGVPLVIVAGLLLCRRLHRAGRLRTPRGLTLLYLLGTVLYVTILGNALEINENYRFRFTIDPLLITIGAMAAAAWKPGLFGSEEMTDVVRGTEP